MQPQLVKIGKLTRLHGIKGALVLLTEGDERPDLQKTETFFVEVNGVPTPFFSESIKLSGKNLILSFDSVKTIQQAEKLLNCAVLVAIADLVKRKAEKDYTGYLLVDKEKGALGAIQEVIDLPGQRMFSVLVKGREVLLPFSADLIEKTDAGKKIIHYCAPPGLIDIYLD